MYRGPFAIVLKLGDWVSACALAATRGVGLEVVSCIPAPGHMLGAKRADQFPGGDPIAPDTPPDPDARSFRVHSRARLHKHVPE